LNPLSNTIVAMLIRMGYVYVLNWNMNTFFETTPNYAICYYVYSIRLYKVKIGGIHSLNMIGNTEFLNINIYSNEMFFLTII
jgi:hypothetical protein